LSGEPRISVVIPTYQRVDGCRRAVESVLAQELEPLEVIVVDDGSSDATEQEIGAWAREDSRLCYVRMPRNFGNPAPARNVGIAHARGDWVALLDDDDRWLPDKLAAQCDSISSGDYDVVACDARRESGELYFGLQALEEPGPRELLAHNPIITSTAVVRRSAILGIGGFRGTIGPVTIGGAEDYDVWLRLAFAGSRFVVLPQAFVVYSDAAEDHLSRTEVRQEARVAMIRWHLWMGHPGDRAVLGSALRGTADSLRWALKAKRAR
jgi:glycosyltransferase involved in cell wall biosynthesis